MTDSNDTVRVAVRIRPLSDYEIIQDSSMCVSADPNGKQIRGGLDTAYTFDNVFGSDCTQGDIYEDCVSDLLTAVFEGFNATILAYGQTGSGKTYTMGSSADQIIAEETAGIIPRFIKNLFHMIRQKEEEDPNHAFKVYVQFLEIYGEDIRDLLDQTRTSKVVIRETRNGEVFLTGAREELVSSFEQMMKALEDGTRNRTTSSTKMNLTSSRSHAIFTVNLEHIIYSEEVKESTTELSETNGEPETKKSRMETAPLNREVRKSKFHFVDLAGSERIKRTGAEGQRMKEGIDINKGLLALGNVISALGDESKRGKVFVPYRDSKLTRMLRDSLGGNSKTLMICCVSPAAINYNESLNALRYANRARNIKNKPIINRDPTLVMIDQMRATLKVVCSELLEIRKRKQYAEIDNRITDALLEQWALGDGDGNTLNFVQQKLDRRSLVSGNEVAPSPLKPTTGSSSFTSANSAELKKYKEQLRERDDTILELKRKANDADFEVKRLTELLKYARQQTSEMSDQLILTKSEADYYRLKWAEAAPQEAQHFDDHDPTLQYNKEDGSLTTDHAELSPALQEKAQFISVVSKLKREIEELKRELVVEKAQSLKNEGLNDADGLPLDTDSDFTSTIASLIAQTRSHLQEESRKLQQSGPSSAESTKTNSSGTAGSTTDEAQNAEAANNADQQQQEQLQQEEERQKEELELEREFAKRQRMLNTEVQELGQSILLKEQLLAQLVKSQEQYARMKTFYETRLQQLSTEMQEKQEEREKLLHELQEIAEKNSETEVLKVRESKLREELRNKDEELKVMKKKQQELRSLAQAQSQYSAQLTKLESDIVSMKKQRVDLTKQLQLEKKNHLAALTEKAREIDRLKRELAKASAEVKRLGKVSETAEQKMKDALREGAMLKKKATDIARLQEVASATNTRLALKAISMATSKQRSAFYNPATNTRKSLSEDEIRIRRWLQQRVSEISTKDAAVENLKQQYEQQLELLQRLEELECERNDSGGNGLNSSGGSGSASKAGANRSSMIAALASRSKDEEEKMMEILDDRVSALNGQLNAKAQKIGDLRQQITQLGEVPSTERVVDTLRKQLQSLPAAHEMVRTLFDMLIASQKALRLSKERSEEFAEKEMTYQQKIDEMHKQVASEKRAYDMELTALTKEYEEKYQHLFQHLSVVGDSYHHLVTNGTGDTNNVHGGSPSHAHSHHLMRRESSFDPMQMQLAISAEETKFLRQQLDREALKYSQLQGKFSELEKIKTGLIRDIAEKNNTIRFLEEERSLFKAMAEEMKSALHSLGKDGKLMVQSIKGKAPRASRTNGLFNEYLNSDSDDGDGRGLTLSGDDADDSQSVLGEFDSLVEEINRTGNVSDPIFGGYSSSHVSSGGNNTPAVPYGGSGGGGANGNKSESIVERLTNPSNFTGSIKTVFKEDLASKRMKTQQIRNQEKQGAHNSKREGYMGPTSTMLTSGTANATSLPTNTSMTGAVVNGGGNSSTGSVGSGSGSNNAGGLGYMAATISSSNNTNAGAATNSGNGTTSGGPNGLSGSSTDRNPPSTPQSTLARETTRRFFADAVIASSSTSSSSSGAAVMPSTPSTASYSYVAASNPPTTPGPEEVRRSLRMTRGNSIHTPGNNRLASSIGSNGNDETEGASGGNSSSNEDAPVVAPPSSASKGSNVFARLASQHIASSYTRHVLARAASVSAGNGSGVDEVRTMSPSNVRALPAAPSTASATSSMAPPPPPSAPTVGTIVVNGKVMPVLSASTSSSKPSSATSPVNASSAASGGKLLLKTSSRDANDMR